MSTFFLKRDIRSLTKCDSVISVFAGDEGCLVIVGEGVGVGAVILEELGLIRGGTGLGFVKGSTTTGFIGLVLGAGTVALNGLSMFFNLQIPGTFSKDIPIALPNSWASSIAWFNHHLNVESIDKGNIVVIDIGSQSEFGESDTSFTSFTITLLRVSTEPGLTVEGVIAPSSGPQPSTHPVIPDIEVITLSGIEFGSTAIRDFILAPPTGPNWELAVILEMDFPAIC